MKKLADSQMINAIRDAEADYLSDSVEWGWIVRGNGTPALWGTS